MTRSEIPHEVRRKGPTGASRARSSEDPGLRRMMASHIHCGQLMQLLTVDPATLEEGNDGGLLTYRCVCGFSFDHRQG